MKKHLYVTSRRDRASRKYILLHHMLKMEVEQELNHPTYQAPWWLRD